MAERPRVKAGLPLNQKIPEADVSKRFRDISAQKLLSAARASSDIKWAAWVFVQKFRKLTASNGQPVYRSESLTIKPNTPPDRIHYFSMRARDPNYKGSLSKCPALKFQCTCERFVFYYEYALYYYGAADLLRCNGQYPVQTNPGLRIGGCKHAIKALQVLISRGV